MSKSPNRLLATIFGAVYLVVGIIGFIATSAANAGFATVKGGLILGLFEVNVLHNIAHLIIGAALLFAGMSSVVASKTTNTTIGAAYLLLGIFGLFVVNSSINFLALNAADNVLHFASAVVLLGVGLSAERVMQNSDVRSNRAASA